MYNLTTKPWVGKNYESGINNKKILVLGKSHHCAKRSDFTPAITIEVIKDLFNPDSEHEPYKNTYTKFMNALSGEKLSIEEKEKWWNRVSFYNYVQVPIETARQSPTAEEFKNSEKAFFEVLEELRPTHIIVWGKRLYNALPNKGEELDPIEMSDKTKINRWEYALNDGSKIKLLEIYHPSSGFSTTYWGEAMSRFLKK